AFLLDFALHLPPAPMGLIDKVPDVSTRQDVYPPFRFLNLALVWTLGVGINKEGFAKTLTAEAKYYSEVSPILTRWINEMHAKVRRRGTPETFFSIEATTRKWIHHLENSQLRSSFPELSKIHRLSMDLRILRPDHWFSLQP